MNKPTEKKKVLLLISSTGDEVIDVYKQLELSYSLFFNEVINTFDAYVQRRTNTVFEHF